MAQLDLPAAIGPYRPLDRLGAGGFGEVFLAREAGGRMLAIKVIHPRLAGQLDESGLRRRLRREVETMERVRHPRVAEIVDFDLETDSPYLVMRYVEGAPLDSLLARGRQWEGAGLRRLARGLAEALAVIHATGCLHRDIKPSNVIVVDGDPVVIDFGIAHRFDTTRITPNGSTGTIGYMAPELIRNEEPGTAVDVFAWAVTIAYAATGVHPFHAQNQAATLHRVLDGEPTLAGVPDWLRRVLTPALDKDPARRPPAARLAELLADPRPRRGGDRTERVEIELADVLKGTVVVVPGPGRVTIPPGCRDGERLTLPGQGVPGRDGGARGDLHVVVGVKPHPAFIRQGGDLIARRTEDLTAGQSYLWVQGLEDRRMVTVPSDAEETGVIRVAGQGLPGRDAGDGRGDLFVQVRVVRADDEEAPFRTAGRRSARRPAPDDPPVTSAEIVGDVNDAEREAPGPLPDWGINLTFALVSLGVGIPLALRWPIWAFFIWFVPGLLFGLAGGGSKAGTPVAVRFWRRLGGLGFGVGAFGMAGWVVVAVIWLAGKVGRG